MTVATADTKERRRYRDRAVVVLDHLRGERGVTRLAIDRADRDEIKRLAQAIIDAQTTKVEMMKPHAAGQHSMHGG